MIQKSLSQRNDRIDRFNNFAILTPKERSQYLSIDLLERINIIREENWMRMDSLQAQEQKRIHPALSKP